MGTTMTMAYVVWPRAFIVHVGDSRCYLLRDGKLEQITTDHTMGAILAQVGGTAGQNANKSSMRHVLWNVLGGQSDELSVDVYKLTLQRDDTLLLCTDGMYGMVPDEQMQSVLNSKLSAEAACHKLVDLANAAGGSDNITVIVSRFLAPAADDERAFVEAEVPLEQLTGRPAEMSQTTISSGKG